MKKNVLVATSDDEAIRVIELCFDSGFKIEKSKALDSCLELLTKKRYEFLFIDIEILKNFRNDADFKNQLQLLWKNSGDAEIIVVSKPESIREAVNAVKAGASNYLTYPLNLEEVKYVIDSLQEYSRLNSELNYLRDRFWHRDSLSMIRTNSPLVKDVLIKVRAVAQAESTVLITGDTGTGKSAFARLVHQHSKRNTKQFIHVNCGGIPESLLESELFGHEKGAFTGAIRRKLGKFEIAHGGTIFLDEISTLSPSMQVDLLQVLQDRCFQRVGGEVDINVDVRIIAATNVNLRNLCDQGLFRMDLYYRLNVFPIELPRLADRIEDLPILIETFLKRLNKINSKNIRDIHPDVFVALQNYSWPGNIRELENLIERAYILESSSTLTPKSFPAELFQTEKLNNLKTTRTTLNLKEFRRQEFERIEALYLKDLLIKNRGKIKQTAGDAGVSERQLNKLMHKYNLFKQNFKTKS